MGQVPGSRSAALLELGPLAVPSFLVYWTTAAGPLVPLGYWGESSCGNLKSRAHLDFTSAANAGQIVVETTKSTFQLKSVGYRRRGLLQMILDNMSLIL